MWYVAVATLNEIFSNRWIGHGGPISWSARSPDITPLDFFLWGILKNIVYQEVSITSENMKQRIIIAACATISPQVLRSVCAFGIERLQCYINANGYYFEYFSRKNHCFISLFNDE